MNETMPMHKHLNGKPFTNPYLKNENKNKNKNPIEKYGHDIQEQNNNKK